MSKYNYNKDYFAVIDNAEKAYWLGFLYADGYICRYYKNDKLKSMTLELTLCKDDRKHLIKFLNSLDSNVPIHEKLVKFNGKEYKEYRITVCCTKMCYDLITLGCTPQKTFDITFPSENIVPKKYIRDWLRGFFDGDGCINTSLMNGSPHIISTFSGIESMMNEILIHLQKQRIVRKEIPITKDKRSQCCELRIYGKDVNKEFLDYLYKDSVIYLDRKYLKYKDFFQNYNEIEKRGVYWSECNKAYIVTISKGRNRIRIGQTKDLQEAINMRKEAEYNLLINNSPLS